MPERLLWVWGAFHALQTDRPMGQALVPIPWSAIRRYAEAEEVADVERFERLIRALDSELLDQFYRERDKEKPPDG